MMKTGFLGLSESEMIYRLLKMMTGIRSDR